ncbi:MAG: hypothetical protein ISQ56_10390, partial [Pseudomonadales bacterium]|nr:hypothetical protein [Pseudomonadales bacterium]
MWQDCLEALRLELPAQAFNTWLRPLRPAIAEAGNPSVAATFTLSAPNRFIQDWVKSKLLPQIDEIFASVSRKHGVELAGPVISVEAAPTVNVAVSAGSMLESQRSQRFQYSQYAQHSQHTQNTQNTQNSQLRQHPQHTRHQNDNESLEHELESMLGSRINANAESEDSLAAHQQPQKSSFEIMTRGS